MVECSRLRDLWNQLWMAVKLEIRVGMNQRSYACLLLGHLRLEMTFHYLWLTPVLSGCP